MFTFVLSTSVLISIFPKKKVKLVLYGSKVGGFKITTMLLATAISNPRLAPGDEPTVGYSIPGTSNVFFDSLFSKVT